MFLLVYILLALAFGYTMIIAETAADGYFTAFISDGISTETWFLLFAAVTLLIIFAGVQNGIERVSKFMMPALIVLAVIIAVYSMTREGAPEGVKYFLVPNLRNFSWMTVVAAMGQIFYSLSIAMGILVTFGSYMKDDVSIEEATRNVEIFDTAIATCLLVVKVIGIGRIAKEIEKDGAPFKRRKIFAFMIRYLCILFVAIILLSSVANVLGRITM